MLRIHFEDPLLEMDYSRSEMYDENQGVYYKGHPFTGIIVGDYWEARYLNGNVDGYRRFFDNKGNRESESIYKDGNLISSTIWYGSGEEMTFCDYQSDSLKCTSWNKNGDIIHEINGEESVAYYPNGKIMHIFDYQGTLFSSERRYYNWEGKEIIRTMVHSDQEHAFYNHDLLSWEYPRLLKKVYAEPNLKNVFNEDLRILAVSGWIWSLYSGKRPLFFKILSKLCDHPVQEVAKTAIQILGQNGWQEQFMQYQQYNQRQSEKFLKEISQHRIADTGRKPFVVNFYY